MIQIAIKIWDDVDDGDRCSFEYSSTEREPVTEGELQMNALWDAVIRCGAVAIARKDGADALAPLIEYGREHGAIPPAVSL